MSNQPITSDKSLVPVENPKDSQLAIGTNQNTAISIIGALQNIPHNEVAKITNATVQIIAAQDPKTLDLYNRAKLRQTGIVFGSATTLCSMTGAIGLTAVHAAASPIIALFSISAVCAGATFAVITGMKVSLKDFGNLYGSINDSIRGRSNLEP